MREAYTGRGSSMCPICPGHSLYVRPHVAQQLSGSNGPMAGSYSPPLIGIFDRSSASRLVTAHTLTRRTSSGVNSWNEVCVTVLRGSASGRWSMGALRWRERAGFGPHTVQQLRTELLRKACTAYWNAPLILFAPILSAVFELFWTCPAPSSGIQLPCMRCTRAVTRLLLLLRRLRRLRGLVAKFR